MIHDKIEGNLINPFDVEDKEKVWKELLENSKSIPKEEAYKRMKEASELQMKEKRDAANSPKT